MTTEISNIFMAQSIISRAFIQDATNQNSVKYIKVSYLTNQCHKQTTYFRQPADALTKCQGRVLITTHPRIPWCLQGMIGCEVVVVGTSEMCTMGLNVELTSTQCLDYDVLVVVIGL